MTENYIQYASGYQKDNIDETDIAKTIADIQLMDDEHGAFWVSVITDDENMIVRNYFILMRFTLATILILTIISCGEKKQQQSSLPVPDTLGRNPKEGSQSVKEKMHVTLVKFEPHVSFSDFHVDEIDTAKAKLDFTSNKGAYRFRTRIREAYKADTVDFAGHYTFVWWGCGSPCQDGVIVDRTTGKIYEVPSASFGYDFMPNSRMLIINSPDSAGFYDDNSAFGKPEILVLDEETKEFIEIHPK